VQQGEWLRHATALGDGAWVVQLTADPLDLDRPEHVATRHPRRDAENEGRANVSARKARDGMISPEQVAPPT